MKKAAIRVGLAGLAATLLAGAGTWLWFELMEPAWEAQARYSPALGGKPMLAATQLLERRGYTVDVYPLLGDADLDALPDGLLVLADNHGRLGDLQARQLLAWVRRGNTLVAQPRWSDEADDGADDGAAPAQPPQSRQPRPSRLRRLDADDPLGAHAGVTMDYAEELRDSCDTGIAPPRKAARPAAPDGGGSGDGADDEERDGDGGDYQFICVTPPGGRYPLVLETGPEVLASLPSSAASSPQPQWSDPDGVALRVYAEGKGWLVMAADNYFNNARLPRYEHAEMLLTLAALRGGAKHVTIVQDINATPWYLALWRSAGMPLAALAVLAALAWWRAARRFGPLLPEPAALRRALLEHIDASGNWLWRVPGGRALLLAAARRETLALLARRAPALRQLEGNALCARLARLHGLDETALHEALYAPAGTHPAVFTRQVRLLQQVRKHYEHHEHSERQ